jgi:N-acetylmuramoyl-L-alanine amidase
MNKKVGICPGHEPNTPGKRTPDGFKEYQFNRPTCDFAITALKRCGLEPIDLNPPGETSLNQRAEIANKNNVACAVYVHFNALTGDWGEWGGIETHCHPDAPSDGGKLLAKYLQAYLLDGTKLRDRGVKYSNYQVLRQTIAPAALVECGFMDNKQEAALMKTEAYQRECAEEITKAICKYLDVKYVPPVNDVTNDTDEKWKRILLEKSAWAVEIWIPFVQKHHSKGLNLKGLIEVLANNEEVEQLKKLNENLTSKNKDLIEGIFKYDDALDSILETIKKVKK